MITIPKLAIRNFLERPRRDYRAWKKLSLEELRDIKAAFPAKPPIWKKLRKPQRVGFCAAVEEGGKFCFWYDMGVGKTALSIALARYYRRVGTLSACLVLVPNKINKDEWRLEIEKHSPSSQCIILAGSSEQKWKALDAIDGGRTCFVIETYAGFARMLAPLTTIKKGRKAGQDKLKPNVTKVRKFCALFQGLVMDESIEVSNKGTLPWRLCRQVAKKAQLVLALNGTPFGRDPIKLWAQMHLVDGGQSLGETLGLFKAALYTETKNYFGYPEWKFPKKNQKLLNRLIAHRSLRYIASDADLPKRVPIKKEVTLPAEAEAYYEKAREAIKKAKGNYQEIENAFLRMRQISSGFLGYRDDETGEKARYIFPENPKLDMLASTIQYLPPDAKFVVFHEYHQSGDLIEKRMKELGVKCLRMYGKTKDANAVVQQFADDPKVRGLLLNNDSGAYGLNRLVAAQYGLIYESPVSPIIRKQIERRIQRQNSAFGTVFIYDFVVRGTVDQRILDWHKQGADLFKAIIEGANIDAAPKGRASIKRPKLLRRAA